MFDNSDRLNPSSRASNLYSSRMSGGNRNDDNGSREGEGGGWWSSKLLKVAGAAAATVAVAGVYALLKPSGSEPEPEVVLEARGVRNKEADDRTVWKKPKAGWVKLNVDGSLCPQSAGCGGVLRDASGEWVRGFAKKLDPNCKVDETEKWAIFTGLQWAWDSGERKLIVESDNEGVVDLVNNGRKSTDPLVCDIRELIDRDWELELRWIQGEANEVADKVTNNAHHLLSFDLHEFYSPPQNCLSALSKDKRNLWAFNPGE